MRALVGAAALGSLVGLSIGGAYLAGGLARTAVVHARISRLADFAQEGFSETALTGAANDAPGALAIARRHDPFSGAVQDARERRLTQWADQLENRRDSQMFGSHPLLLRASLDMGVSNSRAQPIRPFSFRGALDQSRDLQCLTQAVYYEDRGDTPAGMQAVAQVVLNRVRHRAFPKTICGVVFQRTAMGGCQFSFACDGSTSRPVDMAAWRRSQAVAAKAMDGGVMASVGNATYFHAAAVNPDWSHYLVRIGQVGAHIFYRYAGRNGASSMFNGQVEPSAPEASTPTARDESEVIAKLGPADGGVSSSPSANLFLSTTAPASTPAPPPAEAPKGDAKPIGQ